MRVAALALVLFLAAAASASADVRTFALALGARRGVVVLGYLSVGTIERGRGWFRRARPYRLELWQDWGEWYADVSDRGYRRLIAGRVAPGLMRKGFSGLFLDNTDMVEGHGRQRAGMRRLVGSLSRLVHRRGGLLFTQNGEGSIGSTLRFYDGCSAGALPFASDIALRRLPDPVRCS